MRLQRNTIFETQPKNQGAPEAAPLVLPGFILPALAPPDHTGQPGPDYMSMAIRFLSAMRRSYHHTSTGEAMNIDE